MHYKTKGNEKKFQKMFNVPPSHFLNDLTPFRNMPQEHSMMMKKSVVQR